MAEERLESWKEIAAHLKRDVSTVQRWERREGLPVHRHQHDKLGSVYAFRDELDAWSNQGRRRIESADQGDHDGAALQTATWPSLPVRLTTTSPAGLRSRWRVVAVVGVALLGAFVVGVVVGRRASPTDAASRQLTHTLITIQPAEHLSSIFGDRAASLRRPSRRAIALSPDGRILVFSAFGEGKQQLYRRALDTAQATSLAGTEGGSNPFFSPDGRWIGFWADGRLKRISVDGGAPIVLCEVAQLYGASWGSDDVIVYSAREGLSQVAAGGGEPTLLAAVGADEFSLLQPHVLPGAKAILFTVQTRAYRWDDARIDVFVRETGVRRRVLEPGTDARYLRTGHLAYVRDGALLAAPFDLQQLQTTGGPEPLLDGVMHSVRATNTVRDTGAAQVDISDSGTLAFVSGTTYPAIERLPVWVDRKGNVEAIDVRARDYMGPRLSPDGSRLAIAHSVNQSSVDLDIWVYDLTRGSSIRLTAGGGYAWPTWTPDGRRLAFYSESQGPSNLFWQAADGTGKTERLTTSPYHQRPAAWSPDGKALVFSQANPKTQGDIWMASVTGNDVSSRPLVEEAFDEIFPALSPDGRWLAYASNVSGRYEVYVQPFPGPGVKQVVSTDGGREPAWSRDGTQLFYREVPRQPDGPLRMMSVPVTTRRTTFVAGMPIPLFEDRYDRSLPIRSYDVGPDQRFLMLITKEPPVTPVTEIGLVLNWHEELKRKLGGQ